MSIEGVQIGIEVYLGMQYGCSFHHFISHTIGKWAYMVMKQSEDYSMVLPPLSFSLCVWYVGSIHLSHLCKGGL